MLNNTSSMKSFNALSDAGIHVTNDIQGTKLQGSFGSRSNASSTLITDMRRRSTLKGVTTGITGLLRIHNRSLSKVKNAEPKVKFENTYRLQPENNCRFSVERIKQAAVDVMTSSLEHVTYNEVTGGHLACTVADNIKSRIKDMKLPRYKIVCHVMISEEKKHGMEVASMYVWNDKTDNYACATYRNGSISAVAMVHGIYLE